GCALLRKKFKEDMFASCVENGILLDFSDPSNDNINIANALQEPFVVNQDLDKNSSQSPPQINHHCCYSCGDLLEDIFCHQCTCELCGNDAHYGYNCLSKVPIIPNPESFNNQTIKDLPPTLPSFNPTCYSEDGNSFTYDSKSNLVHDSPNVFDPPLQPPLYSCKFCGNDAQSLLNHDSSIISSSLKIDSLFDEFAGKPTHLKSIPPGINETDCDPEEETHFVKRLLYDNSSPRPPKEFISENYDAAIESFSPFPIPVEDIDSLMEEIDLSFTPNDPMPSGIEEDDYDSEGDIFILKELFSNNSLSLPENESFYFDISSFSHPPAKLLDGNTRILNVKMMGDISEQKVPMPRLMLTRVPNQEKSLDLLSHLGHEAFQPSAECPISYLIFPFISPLINSSMGRIGSSLANLNKRFVGGTSCLSLV
nr:hypothetical protein [Tanacetum cinerariifolium]